MDNKIALVTGGTSGIGKEIVKELLDKNCKVTYAHYGKHITDMPSVDELVDVVLK